MHFALTKEQKNFFLKNSYIEFTSLWGEKELSLFTDLQKPGAKDLCRQDDKFKRIIFNPSLAQVAKELTEKKTLRFGFDELIGGSSVQKGKNLQDRCSIKGLEIALLIALDSDLDAQTPPPFCCEKGNGCFFRPNFPFEKSLLKKLKKRRFLLIAWADPQAKYSISKNDPDPYFLKKYGYYPEQLLREPWHPLFR